MEIKSNANIVILAASHNPSILSPQWVKEKLIDEDPINFVNTPEFSLFESANYQFIIDRERIQLSIKQTNNELLKSLSEIAIKIIEVLDQVPYKSIGFNYSWFVDQNTPSIEIQLNSKKQLPTILEGHDLRFGFIVNAKSEDYILKLVTEPSGENMITYNFNYHHEIDGLTLDKKIEFLNNFINLYESSQEIVESTLVGDEND